MQQRITAASHPVSVERSSESTFAIILHGLNEVDSVCQIRIRVMATKVFQRNKVHYAVARSSEFIAEDALDIRPSH